MYAMSRIRAPLSIEQVKEIQGRCDSPDMRAVLWKVRHLLEIAATADELERSVVPRFGMSGLIRASLRFQLGTEPCAVLMPPSK